MMKSNLFRFISLFALIICFSSQAECRRGRLIGGKPTRPYEFKYVVYVASDDGEWEGTCTGGILSQDIILTAAHCLIDENTNQFVHHRVKVIAGTNDINDPNNPGIEIPVEAVMVPSSYNILKGDDSDIALLKLKHPLNLSDRRLARLNLPTIKLEDLTDVTNQRFKLAGFGRTDSIDNGDGTYGYTKEIDGKLRQAAVQLDVNCEKWDRSLVPVTSFCAKIINNQHLEVIGACQGDSGAPLVHGMTVYGVNSFGHASCNENEAPTAFVNVGHFTAFIKQALDGGLPGRFKIADETGYF